MVRMIKAIDAATGKPVMVDVDKLQPGQARKRELSPQMFRRIRAVHETIKDVYGMTLEQFEVAFMRDGDVEADVARWERVAAAFDKVVRGLPKVDRTVVLSTLLGHAMNTLTKQELASPQVMLIVEIAEGAGKPQAASKSKNPGRRV